jgi:hypothetical protein
MGGSEFAVHPNANLEMHEYVSMIRWLYQSASLFHENVKLTVLTSARTNLNGIGVTFDRVDGQFNPASVMQDRAVAHVAYLDRCDFSTPILLLDSDILINASLDQLWSRDFDIALTWRMSEVMPLNGGVLFVSNRRPEIVRSFFRRYLSIFQQRYADQAQWFGDQMALRDAVGLSFSELSSRSDTVVITEEGAKCLLLPAHTFNRSPGNRLSKIVKPIRDAAVLHFKGERKRLMKLYWQAHLEGRRSPLPFDLPLPWRWLRARAALLALRQAAVVEERARAARA